jgi:hypothetical protein
MMMLSDMGLALPPPDQATLYNSNHSHNKQSIGWATDPEGLRYTLDHYKPASVTTSFAVQAPGTEPDGTRDIIDALSTSKRAVAALVFDCQHWIVIRGADTDNDPTAGSYTVDGFYINNPIAYTSGSPPPHSGGDNCGTGGSHGVVNEFITYSAWQGLCW